MDDGAVLQHVSGLHHDSDDRVKKQLVQATFLQNVAEFAQRCFIRHGFRHKVNACEFLHDVVAVDGVPGSRSGQVEPDLKQIHP